MIFYNLTAGYRIKLKEYKSAFSHLDINFDWSFSSRKTKGEAKSTVIDKYFFIWEGEPSNFTLLFNGTINSVSWEINEFSALTANIKLPVFYYDRRLFFEIGLQYKYLFYEYLVTVDREIVDQTATDPAILGPEIETLNHKSSSHLFGGSIIVNYSIINSLNIKGIISTFPSAQLGFEYFLSL